MKDRIDFETARVKPFFSIDLRLLSERFLLKSVLAGCMFSNSSVGGVAHALTWLELSIVISSLLQ
jgi:hypothetical protein